MDLIFSTFGALQSVLIACGGILLTVATFILVFRQEPRNVFEASDGTRFNTEEACSSYESAFEKLKPLYDESTSNLDKSFGFNTGFLELLKTSGFKDLTTLLSYRDDIRKLVEIYEKR